MNSILGDLTPKQRFENLFRVTPGCWVWEGSRNADGYGHFRMNGRVEKAHRASYIFYVGAIPNILLIRHKCNNRSCVNPEHLIPGTDLQNMEDRESSGNTARGERNGKTKLTDAQVREAKELLAQGYFREDVANAFGVSGRTIWYAIKTRKLD
jgi:HNH endonuclease